MSDAKTEEPTPRRERKAREEGRAWQSRDLSLGAVLVSAGACLQLGAPGARAAFTGLFERALEHIAGGAAPRVAIEENVLAGVSLALPLLVGLVAIGTIVSALQVGGVFAPSALTPDAGRLDPSARFDDDAATRMGSKALLATARFALVIAVSIATFVQSMPGIATLSRQPPSAALDACFTTLSTLTLRVGIALLFFGVIDAVVERALHLASLRMSRRDVERERRESEGDAHVRRERDRVREELSRADDLEEAEKAALVVTGDDLAIALSYDEADVEAVPRVAAIARSARMEELVRVAREHGVRCVENDALAAQLAIVAIGGVIPEVLYERVARAMRAEA